MEGYKWLILVVYYLVILDAAHILTMADGSFAWIVSIVLVMAPVLVILYGRYSGSKKPKVAPARIAVSPPPPPPESAPVTQPIVEDSRVRGGVKTEGLTEIIMIKQGPPPDQQYVVEVLRVLHPELAGKNLTVHTENSGDFIPDDIYVITRLRIRKGESFDIANKTVFQQYTDGQGRHGYPVFVYE